jgi:hypothetical protein
MFDLTKSPVFFSAKIGVAVTFLVLSTAACSHQAVAPANNDSYQPEIAAQNIVTEPQEPSAIAPAKAKKLARHHRAVSHKMARHSHTRKTIAKNFKRVRPIPADKPTTVAVASVQNQPPAPEIQMPTAPAPVATLGVTTEADPSADSLWNRLTNWWVLGALVAGLAALAVIAPRARRSSKPKRKLVYNR